MVLTFDDLPAQRAQRLTTERLTELNDAIVGSLAQHRLPAIGFVNEIKLRAPGAPADASADPARVELLKRWLEADLELGNHTYSHPDLHRLPLADFQKDVLRGEEITRPLAAEHGRPLRYFRHPFLRTGRDLETRDGLHEFLAEHGYQVAPVTVDNSEWIFARAYDLALDRDDNATRERLGEAYGVYMEAMVEYYEGQSRALFGREIPQVLLLHANDLNADYLEPLLDRLVARGYRFIDLEEALSDPAYASPDRYVGPGGITWLHRWALTREVDRSMFAGEPATPDWVQELAGIRE